jgi:hypothetical protein
MPKSISCLAIMVLGFVFAVSVARGQGNRAGVSAAQEQQDTSQTELLKQQNTLLERYNSELLQVVIWSLTFAAVFLIGLIGLISYFTTRRYDQENEALQSNLQGHIATAVAQLERRLDEKMGELQSGQETALSEIRKTVSADAEKAARKLVNPIDGRLKSAERDIQQLELLSALDEAKMWDERKVPANSLRSWMEFAAKSKAMEIDWRLTDGLENILRVLKAGGTNADGEQITDLHSFVSSLPSKFEPLVTKIKALL